MDYLSRLKGQIRKRLWLLFIFNNLIIVALYYVFVNYLKLSKSDTLLILVAIGVIAAFILPILISGYLAQPISAIWHAVMHLAPDTNEVAAPELDKVSLGRELVYNLINQLYQLINVADKVKASDDTQLKSLNNNFIAMNLPLPMVVLDPNETIKFANQALADYIGIAVKDLIGKNVYMVLDMSFPSNDTFDNWLKTAKVKTAKDIKTWERVKLAVRDNHPNLMFDLAAYYNRGNPEKNETVFVLFDHTKLYSQEDQAVSFMALSVHELRAPLTLLRGYIEVLREELEPALNKPELKSFMDKMQTQAEMLMAYVNNILNVARVDDDQLEFKLVEENWSSILKSSIEALSLRAKVRGITLHCQIAGNLPSVAVDRLSIQEVMNNLVDNAIKYSGKSKDINIETHLTNNGFVETTVQDFGVGIPTAVMPNLFTKFYRDHRNRAQIGGTGLGLYLAKVIVSAHSGNLWVRSHEGKGSTFGFTLLPYSQLNDEAKASADHELVRTAHGWIKNHSLYRR